MTRNYEESRKEKEKEGKKKGRLKECNVVSMGALVYQHDQEP